MKGAKMIMHETTSEELKAQHQREIEELKTDLLLDLCYAELKRLRLENDHLKEKIKNLKNN